MTSQRKSNQLRTAYQISVVLSIVLLSVAGTAKWYHEALSASPTAHQIPVPDVAWALPDFNLTRRELVVARPVLVCNAGLL